MTDRRYLQLRAAKGLGPKDADQAPVATSHLHIWWARRPLASSQATAFAALIDDPGPDHPEERDYLLDLIKRITPWEAVKDGNSADIEEARQLILKQYGRPPRVLDPFAGGGSIPLEALRLGCETYASDYNPVAVFIEKATLEWPQKFGVEVELPLVDALIAGVAQIRGATLVHRDEHMRVIPAELVRQQDLGPSATA